MHAMLGPLEAIARITVATLFNSLWEAALLAVVVALLLRLMPNASATTRYAAWTVALFASLLLPIATAIPQISVQRTVVQHNATTGKAEHAATSSRVAVTHTAGAAVSTGAAGAPASSLHLPRRVRFSLPEWVAIGLFSVWLLAVIALLVRLALNLRRLETLKTDALPLPLDYRERLDKWAAADKGGREVRLCTCEGIDVPVAVGLFDSMILLPQHLLDTLSQDEIDQIVLHELAHLRRADDWTNGIQRVIQALFFFNPAVLYIAQQLDLEREVACDDWVLRQTESVRPYATCLTRMAEVTAWPHRAMAAPGVFVTRRGLSVRIERLLRAGRDIRTSISFGPAGAVVAALIVLFFVAETVAPTFAFTLQEDITIPAQHIRIPAQTVHIPAKDITTPAQHVHVPAQTVHIAPIDVEVPAQHVHLARHTAQIPPLDIRVPEQHVHAPHIAGAVSVRSVHVPTDMIDEAVNAGLAGAQVGLRAASQAMNCASCDYSDQNLSGKSFRGQRLANSDFSNTNLSNADFSGSVLSNVDFSHANLRGVNFDNAKISNCDLSGADTSGASFSGAQVSNCDIDMHALSPEQTRDWLRVCTGCDFSNANLRGQDLRAITLTGIDLSNADLRDANLSGANLRGVDLSGAHLDGANLNGAVFTGCDLSGVDLTHVDTTHAQFVGDELEGR